jgi:ABC-type polysaccharide/polyol phosphate export permease
MLEKIEKALKSMEQATSGTNNGIGFCGLLTILFIAFKLLGIINWSWAWVLAPIWIPVCIVLAICVIAIIVVLFVALKGENL